MKRLRSAVAAAVVLALAATGCGGGAAEKTVKIGMIAPFTGGLAAFGKGMRQTAQLVIERARAENKIPGWKIEYEPLDDASDAKQGASAAQKLASQPEVGAVIGTLNSSVALAVQPVLKPQEIPMVSPSNTDVSLTQGLNWRTAPKRTYDNYFRVVTTDRQQGQAAAQYAYEDLSRRSAVLIHDKKTYGQGLATIFGDNFTKLGGKVTGTIPINPGEGDYKSAVTKAQNQHPDLIFYGGEYPEAGVIAKNMAELGMKPPSTILLGGDGIVDKTFAKLGKAAAEGHYATTVGASANFLPTAKAFTDAYKARYYAEDWGIYGPPTWDAANIIINVLAEALSGKTKMDETIRKDITKRIQAVNYKGGALGDTTFDKYGDTTNRILTINKLEGGDWKPLGKLTVE